MANILVFKMYATPFNTPRESQEHQFIETRFFPTGKIWKPLDAFASWIPVKQKYDLIHTFNRIPFTNKPWMVTFESILPRTLGDHEKAVKHSLRQKLLSDNCKQLIPMSDYAYQKFLSYNSDWKHLSQVDEKTTIIYPNLPLKVAEPKHLAKNEKIKLIFVGGHFARKGGIVALRIAKKAKEMGLPVEVHIVSSLTYGANVYTDCQDSSKYEQDIKLLELDNVFHYERLPNEEVIKLMHSCHFQILTTLDDTYGYSVIEGFSVGTPAITTNVCAMPEMVFDHENGFMINLELNSARNWTELSKRNTDSYWKILNDTFEYLSEEAIKSIVQVLNNPASYLTLSKGAINQIKKNHDVTERATQLNQMYTDYTN